MKRVSFLLLISISFLNACAHSPQPPDRMIGRPDYIYSEKYFKYQETRVVYIEGGNKSGQSIIFLHGVLGTSHTWRLTMKALAEDYHVIAIDLPGYGKSEKGGHLPLTISYYANLIHEFIEWKDLEESVLVGTSLGGHIALYYAINFPYTISKAVVVGTVGVDRDMKWYEDITYALLWNEPVLKKALSPKRLKEIWEGQFVCTHGYDAEYDSNPIFHDKEEYELLIDAFQQSVGSIFETSLKDDVQRIQLPVLILWGGKDQYHNVKDAYYLKDQIKNSTLAISPNCGHVIMLDDPEFVNEALMNWMETGDPQVPQYSLEDL